MPTYFLDSSALVKAYRQENGTQRVVTVLNGVDPIVVARLAQVEVSSAIVRRARTSGMTAQAIAPALGEMDREFASVLVVVELTAAVVARAISLTRVHGLRAADALQLSCALHARDSAPQEQFSLLSSDNVLNAAAAAEGFTVIDPAAP